MLTISCLEGEVILGVDARRDTHAAVLIDPLEPPGGGGHVRGTTRRGMRALMALSAGSQHPAPSSVEGAGQLRRRPDPLAAAGGRGGDRSQRAPFASADAAWERTARATLKAPPAPCSRARRPPSPRRAMASSNRSACCADARASAVEARAQAMIQLKTVIITAPDALREDLGALRTDNSWRAVDACSADSRRDALSATRHALRSLARRHQALDAEIAELDGRLAELTAQAAPRLLTQPGIGPEIAARLLLVAGDNPTRLRNDAALAALCGASPIEASKRPDHPAPPQPRRRPPSQQRALADRHQPHDPPPPNPRLRRPPRHPGKSTKEIRRCLMRHIARGIYPLLKADLHDARTLLALT